MKGRARHTRPPYSVDLEPLTGGGARICAVKGGQVVTVAFTTETNHDKDGPRAGFVGQAEAVANAQFLAHAGNCHGELVEALKGLSWLHENAESVDPKQVSMEQWEKAEAAAVAALKKAGVSP